MPRLPEDQDDAASVAPHSMHGPRRIDDKSADRIVAAIIGLRAIQDENVFVAAVLMDGNAGAGLIAEKSGDRSVVAILVQTANVNTRPEGFPVGLLFQRRSPAQQVG